MTLNPQILGQRLRAARDNLGISQQAAAEAVGLPRTAITQIEAGNRSVSTLELSQLADIYKRPVSDFFTEEMENEDDLLVTLHRIAPNLDQDSEVREQVARCLSICRDGAELEKILGRSLQSGPPAYQVPDPGNPFEAIQQGSRVADQERQRLGLGTSPIADMADLISNQGVWASGAALPNEMSGLFLRHPSIGMAILVNYGHPRVRKRFSYAHEYAHALMDRGRTVTVSTQGNASELIEKRANAFAAAFLMPAAGVDEFMRAMDKGQGSRQERQVFDVATEGSIEAEIRPAPGAQAITYQDVAMLAHHYGVSYQAATYRLSSLDIISRKACDSLLKDESYGRDYLDLLKVLDDLEEADRQANDREFTMQVVHLAVEAYRREEISRGRLMDLGKKLGLPGRKLTALAEAAKDKS